jgi:hypothetical protein
LQAKILHAALHSNLFKTEHWKLSRVSGASRLLYSSFYRFFAASSPARRPDTAQWARESPPYAFTYEFLTAKAKKANKFLRENRFSFFPFSPYSPLRLLFYF